jgi:ABC-type hemin transport system substrate-binding protein
MPRNVGDSAGRAPERGQKAAREMKARLDAASKATREKTARLRSLRLAQEAAEREAEAANPPPAKKKTARTQPKH